ncbi:hypothetical protein ACLOJK_004480 [Asimina triloba]
MRVAALGGIACRNNRAICVVGAVAKMTGGWSVDNEGVEVASRDVARGTSSSQEGCETMPKLPGYWSHLSVGRMRSRGSMLEVLMAPLREVGW